MITTGTVLEGRYRVDEHLSRGGVGDVFLAHDVALERDVAVKVVRADEADHPDRFRVEARALARLDHPGIVSVHDVGEHGDAPFLVMELVRGDVLSERMSDGPLPPAEVARIGAALAGALAYAHDQGVVHRDVKPGNVLFDERDEVHLADFGIARLAGSARLTDTGMTVGTAAYLSPEQLAGEAVGPETDVYSLGLVLLEALTGQRPFAQTDGNAMLARLHLDPDVPANLPEPWPRTLRHMLARDPGERPRAAEVAKLLGGETAARPPETTARRAAPAGAAGGARRTQVLDTPATASTSAPQGSRRRLRLVSGATAALAVAVLAAALTVFAVDSGASSEPVRESARNGTDATSAVPVEAQPAPDVPPRQPAVAVPDGRTARMEQGSGPNVAAVQEDRGSTDAPGRKNRGNADPPGKGRGHGR